VAASDPTPCGVDVEGLARLNGGPLTGSYCPSVSIRWLGATPLRVSAYLLGQTATDADGLATPGPGHHRSSRGDNGDARTGVLTVMARTRRGQASPNHPVAHLFRIWRRAWWNSQRPPDE
jgi:hypothetical protein